MSKPYTVINPKLQSYETLRDSLVTDAAARQKFDQINQHLRRQLVLPGELVIVGDATTRSQTWEERHLMSYAGAAAAGGVIGSAGVGSLCFAMGIPTAGWGALVCAIVGGAGGAWFAGTAGSTHGEKDGMKLYESLK